MLEVVVPQALGKTIEAAPDHCRVIVSARHRVQPRPSALESRGRASCPTQTV